MTWCGMVIWHMVDSFPRTLAYLRKDKKISQKEAAASLGISQALLSHYENGLREPGLEFAVKAAAYYGVTTDYLLGITNEKEPAPTIRDDSAGAKMIHGDARFDAFQRVVAKTGNRRLAQLCEELMSLTLYRLFLLLPDNGEEKLRGERALICEAEEKRREAELFTLFRDKLLSTSLFEMLEEDGKPFTNWVRGFESKLYKSKKE